MRSATLDIAIFFIFYCLFFNVSGQSLKKEKLWSNKERKAFYSKYVTDTSTVNDVKVVDCMFEKVQKKFSSLKKFNLNTNAITPIQKSCSRMVFVPVTNQLSQMQVAVIHDEMFRLVNNFRKDTGNVHLLQMDPDLDSVAKIQSDYNAWNSNLSHEQRGNNKYSTVEKRIAVVKKDPNKTSCYCGENIADIDYDSDLLSDINYLKTIAKELFDLWVNSEGHRENMLYKYYKYLGFAVTVDADEELIYATQVFSNIK